MVLKNIFAAIVCTMLLASSGLSMADEYRAEEFLGLDLSKAVLSPNPLGPSTQFAPVPVEAKADSASQAAQAPVEPKANPSMAVSRTSVPRTGVAHVRADKPRGAARTELARRHGNPLDAQALDTRIQVWPCKSGGICNWQRQGN